MKITHSFKHYPLWKQITVALFIICSSIVFATGKYINSIEHMFLTNTLKQNRQHIFDTIASSSIESIIVEDVAALETLVSELIAKNSDIFSLSINNENHKKLVSQFRNKLSVNTYLIEHTEPLVYENEIFGFIDIQWDMTKRHNEIKKHIDSIYLFQR